VHDATNGAVVSVEHFPEENTKQMTMKRQVFACSIAKMGVC
jgi:hypothetical protein